MKKLMFFLTAAAILLIGISSFVSSHGEETFAEAEEIIGDKISCDDLSEEQLEILGEYYMEQMHPEEAHVAMDEMMGGEGSESLRIAHVNMGKSFYCGKNDSMSGGMMNMMMGGSGMMGNYYSSESNAQNIFSYVFSTIIIILLILLIIWLAKKLMESGEKKRRRKK